MNIHEIETHIDPTIFYRGLDYYEDGLVFSLDEREGGWWQALVQGSRIYKTKVRLVGEEVVSSSCNCPYDWGGHCKHEVAAILAIRDRMSETEAQHPGPSTPPKTPQNKSDVRKLAEGAKKEELVDFLAEAAEQFLNLRETFLLRFAPTTKQRKKSKAKEVKLDYRKMIQQAAEDPEDEWGHYVDEYELDLALSKILVRGRKLEEEGNYPELLEMGKVMVSEVAEMMERIEEDSGGVMESVGEAIGMLARLSVKRQHAEAEAALDFLLERLLPNSRRGWEFDREIWDEFSGIEFNEEEQERLETVLESAVSQTLQSNSEYYAEKWIERYAQFLEKYRTEGDADALLRQYIDLPKCREKLVRKEMAAGRYGQAKRMLREGIEFADAKQHPGTARKWQEMLLEVAVLDEDDAAVRVLREQLFYNGGRYDFQQYEALKAAYGPEKWPEKVEKLLAELDKDTSKSNWFTTNPFTEILYREKQFDRLANHLAKSKIHLGTLIQYWDGLKIAHSELLAERLTLIIRQMATHTGTRPHYREIAGLLKKLGSLPAHKPVAKALRDELVRTYPRRRAMVEELGGAIL